MIYPWRQATRPDKVNDKKRGVIMSETKWKSASDFEKFPQIQTRETVGQETIGKYLGSKTVISKKDGEVYVFHKIEQDGVVNEFLGSGLLNWLLDPANGKVKIGQSIKIVYKGLENPEKKSGKGNRHQFELFTAVE